MEAMSNNYKMQRPTGRDVQDSLFRVFGQAKGLERWNQACRAALIPPGRVDLMNVDELLLIAKKLEAMGGASRVVACSIKIRINTFKSVERLGGDK